MSCLPSLSTARHELCSPMFDLSEPTNLASRDGRTESTTSSVDIFKTFSPIPQWGCIFAKLFLTVWVLILMAMSILQTSYPGFWLAYLTNWGWTVTVAYFVCSLGTAVYLVKCGVEEGFRNKGARLLVNTTWALYAIALPGEVIICLLYWFLEFSGSIYYVSMMLHGIGIILILIDGLIINRVPIRMKQFYLFEAFSALYLLWNIMFSFSELSNPYRVSGEQDDDAIYGTMKWKTDTTSAVILALLVLLLGNPIVFVLCRGLSRLLPRRLVEEELSSGDVEMGQTVGN